MCSFSLLSGIPPGADEMAVKAPWLLTAGMTVCPAYGPKAEQVVDVCPTTATVTPAAHAKLGRMTGTAYDLVRASNDDGVQWWWRMETVVLLLLRREGRRSNAHVVVAAFCKRGTGGG